MMPTAANCDAPVKTSSDIAWACSGVEAGGDGQDAERRPEHGHGGTDGGGVGRDRGSPARGSAPVSPAIRSRALTAGPGPVCRWRPPGRRRSRTSRSTSPAASMVRSPSQRGDLVGSGEDGGVLRATDAVGEVAAVVGDEQERAAGGQRPHGAGQDRGQLVGRQVQVADEHEIEGRLAGWWLTTSATTQSTSTPRCAARRRPLSMPAAEKSTATTDHPCSANHTALRPSPAARSSARPGCMASNSATTNWFAVADHRRSASA